METKEKYKLAWRYWRCVLYEDQCWDRMDDDEKRGRYDEIDSPATHNYWIATKMTEEAKSAYLRAGVPDFIMMRAKRHLAQRELTEFTGKRPFIRRNYPSVT
jgi:hypothetical protein